MGFEKATKDQTKVRLFITGPTGCGKTYTAMRIGSGILEKTGGKMAVICTERKSARKYAGKFKFEVSDLTDYTIEGYSKEIKLAANNFDVLIIDSLSHAWQKLLEHVDKLTKTQYKGNSYLAWSDGTPIQQKFIDLIFSFPGHVICTARSKMETVMEPNEKGKMSVRKVGLAPVQRQDLEYEFDITMTGDQAHTFHVDKDRSELFQDQYIEKPGEKMGIALAEWLEDGEPPKTQEEIETEKTKSKFNLILDKCDTIAKLQELKVRVDGKSLPETDKGIMKTEIEKRIDLKKKDLGEIV